LFSKLKARIPCTSEI